MSVFSDELQKSLASVVSLCIQAFAIVLFGVLACTLPPNMQSFRVIVALAAILVLLLLIVSLVCRFSRKPHSIHKAQIVRSGGAKELLREINERHNP